MEKFFHYIFFCFFLIKVSWGSDRNFEKNRLFSKKEENHCFQCRTFLKENTKLKNQLAEILKKERISKNNSNNDSLEREKGNKILEKVESIKNDISQRLSQSLFIPSMKGSFISDCESEKSIIFKTKRFEFDASLYNLFPSENNENKEEELHKENQTLKDRNEFLEKEFLEYKKYLEKQDEELIKYKSLIEDCEKKLSVEDEQRHELLNESDIRIKSLYEANEILQNNNSALENENNALNALLKELKENSEKKFETYSTQTDNPKIKKTVFGLEKKVFGFSIMPTKQESERYLSPVKSSEVENNDYNSKNLFSELEDFQSPMNIMFLEKDLNQERTCLQKPSNVEPRVNSFYDEKIEKKMLEERTQTEEEKKTLDNSSQNDKETIEKKMSQAEEEKKIGDSFILLVIKKNKKLFLSLGFISVIATLFYLKKEKVIYWYSFLR